MAESRKFKITPLECRPYVVHHNKIWCEEISKVQERLAKAKELATERGKRITDLESQIEAVGKGYEEGWRRAHDLRKVLDQSETEAARLREALKKVGYILDHPTSASWGAIRGILCEALAGDGGKEKPTNA